MEFLPMDFLLAIFTKLPCKDIVVCRCVCREWYHLLSHPNFTREYTQNSPFTSLLLIQRRLTDTSSLLIEFSEDGGVVWTHLKPQIPNFQTISCFPKITDNTCTVIIGSCNGLLFFGQTRSISNTDNTYRTVDKVYCCNPLLGDCVELAEEENQEWQIPSPSLWHVRYMIGYIASTDTIKLLRIGRKLHERNDIRSYILTVGIDRRWRRIDEGSSVWHSYHFWRGFIGDKMCTGVRGVSFNGAYHWVNTIHEGNFKSLCTFDFGKEKIGPKWKLPKLLQHWKQRMYLVVLKDRLSLIDIDDRSEMRVWMMEEYGVAESWYVTRKIRIGDCYRPFELMLVAIFANGVILFRDCIDSKLISLSTETDDAEVKVHDFDDLATCLDILHVAECTPKFYQKRNTMKKVWSSIEGSIGL